MKIGLYFGSFNPIHIGHLVIANHLAEYSDLDQIWFVVTPHNPFKKKSSLLDNHQRLEMVYRATKDYSKLKPSDKVIVDDFEGARHATNRLIKSGCKRIALISVIDNLSVGKLRAKGYEEALNQNNIKIDDRLIVKIGKREDFDTAMKIVLADKSIDGLLCLEESSAVQSLELVKKMNYKIPEQMSIICFTNGKLPQYVSPKITTISQHGKFIGEMAANILIERLESKEENKPFITKVIKTSLIERESTKPVL